MNASEKPSPGRRFQFSLRMLLVLTAVIAALLGWQAYQASERRAVAEELQTLGCFCELRSTWSAYLPGFTEPWLNNFFFADVVYVGNLPIAKVELAIPLLKRLRRLKHVYILTECLQCPHPREEDDHPTPIDNEEDRLIGQKVNRVEQELPEVKVTAGGRPIAG